MRNLIEVAWRFNRSIEKLTTRHSVNYGLRQYSVKSKSSKNSRFKNKELQKIKESSSVRCVNNAFSQYDDDVEALQKKKLQIDKNNLSTMAAASKFHSKKGTMSGTYLRIIDKKTAQKFVDLVMSKPAKNPAYVAELNPGLGLMTTPLLDAGVSTINLFEALPPFHPILDSLAENYPGRIRLKKFVFDHLWRIGYLDWMNETNQLPIFLEDLDRRKWSDDPTFNVIGAIVNSTLIVRYMAAIIFHNSLAKFGRVIFHIAMPPSLWDIISSDNTNWRKYTSRTVMFQTIFDYELLGTVPRAGFFPQFKKKLGYSRRNRNRLKYDKTLMCVVRIEAKKDLYEKVLTKSDIIPFFYFIKHHLKRRSSRIIPELEKWIPGCGRDLITAGFDVTTEFGELLPPELVKLFLRFKSWPGYKKSSFITMVDAFEKRLDEQIMFGSYAEKVDEMFKLSKDATIAQAESKELNDKSKSSE